MSADDVRALVLQVLAGQSPDYFAFPNASAFVAEGLDPVDVADVLAELHAAGQLERELIELPDADPIAGGYRLTPTDSKPTRRRTKMSETFTETPQPAEPETPETETETGDDDEEEGGEGDGDEA